MKAREIWAGIIGLVAGLALLGGLLDIAYTHRAADAYAAAHPSGWVERTGQVVWTGQTNYSAGRPVLPSIIRYRDYAGIKHDVNIDMPIDTTKVGNKPKVAVAQDESVIVWNAANNNNQSSDWPYPGSKTDYDVGWAYFGGIVGGIVLGGLVGVWTDLLFQRLAEFRGRLGTR